VFDPNDPIRRTSHLEWDGDFRWAQIPNSADLDLRTSGSWVVIAKPDANWAPWSTMLSRATGSATRNQYSLMRYNSTNQLDFYTGNDAHPYRGGAIPYGVWSVLTVTLNGGVLKGYIDKIEVFSFNNVPALNFVAAELRFGTFGAFQYNYRGGLGAALLYNRALTPDEIAQNCDYLKTKVQ
jgi:hypothetical protein